MKGSNLGEFEELVLLCIGLQYPDAYGVSVKKEILNQTGRKVTLSTVHSALNRLEKKGFIESHFGDATQIRGGKRKKLFAITMLGLSVLREVQYQRNRMWSSFPEVLLEKLK